MWSVLRPYLPPLILTYARALSRAVTRCASPPLRQWSLTTSPWLRPSICASSLVAPRIEDAGLTRMSPLVTCSLRKVIVIVYPLWHPSKFCPEPPPLTWTSTRVFKRAVRDPLFLVHDELMPGFLLLLDRTLSIIALTGPLPLLTPLLNTLRRVTSFHSMGKLVPGLLATKFQRRAEDRHKYWSFLRTRILPNLENLIRQEDS